MGWQRVAHGWATNTLACFVSCCVPRVCLVLSHFWLVDWMSPNEWNRGHGSGHGTRYQSRLSSQMGLRQEGVSWKSEHWLLTVGWSLWGPGQVSAWVDGGDHLLDHRGQGCVGRERRSPFCRPPPRAQDRVWLCSGHDHLVWDGSLWEAKLQCRGGPVTPSRGDTQIPETRCF